MTSFPHRSLAALALFASISACSSPPQADRHGTSASALTGASCCTTAAALVTWDPGHAGSIITVSPGALEASSSVQQQRGSIRATLPRCSGKWYWEVVTEDFFHNGLDFTVVGVGTANAPLAGDYIGGTADGWAYFPANAEWMHDAEAGGWAYDYGTRGHAGDVIGIALDLDKGTVTFTKNGVVQGTPLTGLPTDGTPLYPMLGAADMYFGATAHFSGPFAYAPPPGFSAYGGVASTTWDSTAASPILTISDGGFTASTSVQQQRGSARATQSKTSGKWYWEVTSDDYFHNGLDFTVVGAGSANAPLTGDYIGGTADGWAYFPANAEWMHDAEAGGWAYNYGTPGHAGDVIGIALDLDEGIITFSDKGVVQGMPLTGLPTDGTPLYPMIGAADMYFGGTARFSPPFEYSVPDGYLPFDPPAATCN